MKLKLFKKFLFKEAIFPWILILIGVILSYQNYSPSTYLSGWDTIHPEFNMGDYFKRILSVWQQHQGLGAVAAQAHASELPRMIIYFLLSLFLPPEVLRYVFLFICLIIGPLGVYFFIKKVVLEHQENYLSKEIISFLGGLLYLLNLATLQLFFVPLEMFEIHYATLGWIFLFATRYIQTSRKKYLFLFIPTIILSGSMAHTPTLFYIFFLIFFIYLTTFIFYNRAFFKKSLLIVLLTILLNLYWILPNLYFVKNYGGDVTNSKIHSEFSDRAFQVGRNFGNIRDSALLKNFLFDWGQYDGKTGSFFLLLGDWETHLKNPRVSLIGIVIFLFVLIGLIYGLRRRNKIAFSFLPVFLITFFFIANDNPLFVGITTFLEKISPVIKETLRFPFTKFSILLLFSFCVYFSLGIYFLINLFKNNLYSKLAILLTFSILLIYFMLPVFKGNLFDPKLKVKIPSEYFQTFKYFDTQDPNSRVASFPVNSFWG
ncbi:hypothetical protein HYS91_05055, partial [Candidatus Daviesbacteria bacterium]|nr:hypothetical protein [Candidatus Daviesbacteria bacterium]